jgi:hypothetical protein
MGFAWMLPVIGGPRAMPKDEERDENEIARRMERGLRRAFNMPPQPHGRNPKSPPPAKQKERPASKGRIHKGKTRS